MGHHMDAALPDSARREGLLQIEEVLAWLKAHRRRDVTVHELAAVMGRPVEQVLHAVSYLASMGMLRGVHADNGWRYVLAA